MSAQIHTLFVLYGKAGNNLLSEPFCFLTSHQGRRHYPSTPNLGPSTLHPESGYPVCFFSYQLHSRVGKMHMSVVRMAGRFEKKTFRFLKICRKDGKNRTEVENSILPTVSSSILMRKSSEIGVASSGWPDNFGMTFRISERWPEIRISRTFFLTLPLASP